MSKYGHRPHNWFEAIVNKLGGEADAERFLRDELVVINKALLVARIVLWRVFEARAYESSGVQDALKSAGVRFKAFVDQLVNLPSTAGTIEFSRVSPRQLGFTKTTSIYTILSVAEELGYKLCRSEDAVAVALGYSDQPLGERVYLATYPVKWDDGGRYVLCIGRDEEGQYISMGCDGSFSPDFELIFRK